VPVSYRGKGGGFGSVETNRRMAKAAIEFVRLRYEQDDRRHLACVVTAALTPAPKMFTYSRDDFSKKIQLDPIAFRAQALSE